MKVVLMQIFFLTFGSKQKNKIKTWNIMAPSNQSR